MFGRLPWFALLRRMRAFFFLVFFDMGSQVIGAAVWFLGLAARPTRAGLRAHIQEAKFAMFQVLRPWSFPQRAVNRMTSNLDTC